MDSKPQPLTTEQENACVILSDLFLDVEFTPRRTVDLVSSIKATRVDLQTLELIFRNDLFPVLYPNIFYPYEWVGFERKWLIQAINTNRTVPKTWTYALSDAALATVWNLGHRRMFPTWIEIIDKLRSEMDDGGTAHNIQPVDPNDLATVRNTSAAS